MTKFRSFRTNVIVLKHQDWAETDRILTIYSREYGKLKTVARGVRKIRSRRAGHLEPFTHVSLQLARSKDMPIITQAEAIDSFTPLRDNLKLIGHASYVIELIDKFTYHEGENLPLFNLLLNTLKRLTESDLDIHLVIRYFELRLLDFTGFRPDLFHCVECGNEIKPEKQYFSAARGGAVCPRCASKVEGLMPISLDALRFLRHLQRSRFKEATRAKPSEQFHKEMEIVMQHYITFVLERGLNTPKFIRRVNKD